MMVANMKDYVTLDPDLYDADFRYGYRDTMELNLNKVYRTKFSVFNIKVKVIKLILSRTEIDFGLIILMIRGVQYLRILIFMFIAMMDWIILLDVQKFFLRLEN